jgi:hypothetical protein
MSEFINHLIEQLKSFRGATDSSNPDLFNSGYEAGAFDIIESMILAFGPPIERGTLTEYSAQEIFNTVIDALGNNMND